MKQLLFCLFIAIFCFACKEEESLEEQWEDCCMGENVSIVNDSTFVMLPTAFSPNGDGVNDVFHVLSSRVVTSHIKIWNVNDDMVFESTMMQAVWDGFYNGNDAAQGRYTFTIEWETLDQQQLTLSGTVCLVRDCLPANASISDCQFEEQFNPSLPGFDASLPNAEVNYTTCN